MPQPSALACVRCSARYPIDHYAQDCPACRTKGAPANLTVAYDSRPGQGALRDCPRRGSMWRWDAFLHARADEAVTLGDKIMVMTASPGHAKTIIDVPLERPRNVLELRHDPRYKKLVASTADAFCPTLRGRVNSQLDPAANVAYEIVIDGLNLTAVERAMAVGTRAACSREIVQVTAGNYGGSLGPYHIRLLDVLSRYDDGDSSG